MREATGFGIKVGNKILSDLGLSDDTTVLETVERWYRELFDKVSDKAERGGQKIKIDETKSMITSGFPLELIRRNSGIEQIHKLEYLSDWVKYKDELQLYYLNTATS